MAAPPPAPFFGEHEWLEAVKSWKPGLHSLLNFQTARADGQPALHLMLAHGGLAELLTPDGAATVTRKPGQTRLGRNIRTHLPGPCPLQEDPEEISRVTSDES